MSVGKNLKHDSSQTHVSGRSIYVDDRSPLRGELQVGVVGAPIANGIIKSIDYSEALKVPGVACVITAEDIAHNHWGTIVSEQPILIDKKIGYIDEPLCVIAADTKEAIQLAKAKIKIDYQEEKAIHSISEALALKQFICEANPFKRGDVETELKAAPHKLKGVFICGGQEHFYMENQSSIVYPMENGHLEVHSSSQHPSETQRLVAEACNLKLHEVVCIVKRMGGGFGGKESQAAHFAALAALVAQKTKRAARIVLTKDEDMQMTGKRHPFEIHYEIGFDNEGKILAFKSDIYSDGGAYTDLSPSILERAMFHIDGAYYLPVCEINGACLRTNNHSNTAFRGFGGPQGLMAMESILEDMAKYLKKDALELRLKNLYGIDERDKTPYGQKVENNTLPEVFQKIIQSSDYYQRRNEIEKFNLENNGKLRGLSLTATKFGIAFTAKFLNQGNAQVNLHLDGTVQASTGATEMGQGVNSKIAQVIASSLGINYEDVQVMATSTEKNHNTSPTAASSGSDINCAAALMASDKIKKRLSVIAHKYFNGDICDDIREWEIDEDVDPTRYHFKERKIIDTRTNKEVELVKIIQLAYMNRISLGEYAHFKTKGLGFDKKRGLGRPFNYFTNGAAVSEIEIDEYTGEVKVLRSDLLMDLGRMINPGIDRGQVSGAFIQGMGWVTTERLAYADNGRLLTHSPTTYKIPNIQDTPRVFNIDFIENDTTTMNVHRSKAVGEPPFLLGISVWTAIKNALYARKEATIALESPATNQEVMKWIGIKNPFLN